jgi:tetratricopeptide (TPR) repeat protein
MHRMKTMIRAFGLALTAAVLALGGADAQAGDPLVARQITDKAIEAQASGLHERAVALFDEAIAEVDHPKIRYFRAKSLDALGRRAEALTAFKALVGVSEVEKYSAEIDAYIRAIEVDTQASELAAALERERAAREAAERQRREAQERAEEAAVKVLGSRRSGLLPPPASRLRLGPVSARMVPLEPVSGTLPAGLRADLAAGEVRRQLERFDRFDTERTVAGVLSVVALVGIGGGAGLAFGPFGDDGSRDTFRTAGLTAGIIGVVSALAAAAVWPSVPDTGLATDALK